jgi:hypothetical protein
MPQQYIEAKNVSLECINDSEDFPWDEVWENWMMDEDGSEPKVKSFNKGVLGGIHSFLHPQNNRLSAFLVSRWRRLG